MNRSVQPDHTVNPARVTTKSTTKDRKNLDFLHRAYDEIAVLDVLSCAQIQSFVVHETIDYDAEHLFPVLREEVQSEKKMHLRWASF